MSIVPLGNRVSVPLQANRAFNGLQSAQNLLSFYEQQIMTQRQYQFGSDSPYSASTALNVQSLVERKTQNATNLNSSLTFLTASDSTLSRFESLTDEARGSALTAINTTTSDTERAALADTISQSLQQMLDFGNYSYQGRYVFAGSTTGSKPFEWGSDAYTVVYTGSISNVHSWSDTDILSQSNLNGADVFGAVSEPVRGSADLNPSVSDKTLLADLNGGKGVEKGMIRFTYTVDGRSVTQDVDLSDCSTLADVERKIENMKNPNFSVNVDLTRNGLVLSLPEGSRGTVAVSEVGKNTVARQLGIPTGTAFSHDQPLVGRDTNPRLASTSLLSDILGSKAGTTLRFAGNNNDIRIQANHNGENDVDPETGKTLWPLNDVGIVIQSDWDVSAGNEFAEYDSETQQVIVHINPDNTNANNIIAAINSASEAGTIPPLTASLDGNDMQRSDLAGTGTVSLLPGTSMVAGVTEGGSGVDFDKTGIEVVNGNATHQISFEHCETVGDLLAELNDPKYGLLATINDKGTGIDIRSRISGADFCIGENGGKTATQLGVRTTGLHTRLDELDFGRGVTDDTSPGMHATARHTNVTPDSGLILTARNEGKEWNDYTVNFVPSADGNVVVSMDEESKVITIGINPGVTTACQVVEAFNAQPGPKQYFDLELDTTDGPNTGEGVVYDGFATTAGGTDGGVDFTITRNDGTVMEIDIHGAETLGDVLRIINEHPDNADGLLVATLAANGNGIELTDHTFGSSTTRVDRTLLSTAAIELGLVNRGEEYRTSTTPGTQASGMANAAVLDGSLLITAKSVGTYANDVNVEFVEGPPGFTWDAASQTLRFSIEPGVTTANDVVTMFQNEASETVRSMFDIQIGPNADGQPGNGTGLVELGDTTLTGGTDNVLQGDDPNPQETDSLYNAMIRLQTAMEQNDTREIERATQLLDTAIDRLSSSRATIGIMQTSLDNVAMRLEEEYIQHEATLNNVLRIDYSDASINYMSAYVAYQASMTVTSSLFQMSLLNYL